MATVSDTIPDLLQAEVKAALDWYNASQPDAFEVTGIVDAELSLATGAPRELRLVSAVGIPVSSNASRYPERRGVSTLHWRNLERQQLVGRKNCKQSSIPRPACWHWIQAGACCAAGAVSRPERIWVAPLNGPRRTMFPRTCPPHWQRQMQMMQCSTRNPSSTPADCPG